jgi:hypothetical protein
MGWAAENQGSSPDSAKGISFHNNFQTTSVVFPATYLTDTEGSLMRL